MRWPSSRISTRSPSSPRMTGRAGQALRLRIATPGSYAGAFRQSWRPSLSELLAGQYARRLIRFELVSGIRAHRHDFAVE